MFFPCLTDSIEGSILTILLLSYILCLPYDDVCIERKNKHLQKVQRLKNTYTYKYNYI